MRVFTIVLTIFLGTLYVTPSQAQPAKALGKVARWVGEIVLTSAIESVVDQEIEQRFYSERTTSYGNYQARNFQLTITNDYPYYSTYFWISTDGQQWFPYVLYPGQYFYVRSGQQGVIAVFNGSQVRYFNQGGRYFASQFFY